MYIALLLIALIGFAILGFLYWCRRQRKNASKFAQTLIDQAQIKANLLLEEAKIKKREASVELEQKKLYQERELEKQSLALLQREEEVASLKQKMQAKEQELKRLEKRLKSEEEDLARKNQISIEETKEALRQEATEAVEKESLLLLLKKRQQLEAQTERDAHNLIIQALSRLPHKPLHDASCTAFCLPNEEMKAKIIGRDGKNIKAFQQLSGVTIVIDETPEMLQLSSFDLERREIAKSALSELIRDGRITPARIEEELTAAKNRLPQMLIAIGQEAAGSCHVSHLHPELLRHLGLLHLRASLGQNLLEHSVEVANIMANIAVELKLDVAKARRMGLLHDIGKAMHSDGSLTHAIAGYRLLLEFGETEEVANGVGSHHDEMLPKTLEASLVKGADFLSGARRGARAESSETFFKRLADLEREARSFDGVKNAFALSAGRELQVFVKPDLVDDLQALQLAKAIAKKIQPLAGPLNIQVNVIRQTQAIVYTSV